MREIQFRAWDDGKKEWLMGYEMPNLGGFSLLGEMVLLGEWSHILNEFLFDRNGHKVDDLKVMQFTGLKDKNGKEIYEGDILHSGKTNWVVVWDESGARYKMQTQTTYTDLSFEGYLEVIGNIYENPDLLPYT
jgi:uncharacterized phage protein (TIGR01671 family)